MNPLLLLILISLLPTAHALDRPNVIIMVADDLGWADVGFHGGNVPTPNLRQLLSEGVELRQHYVAPVCRPPRPSTLSRAPVRRLGQ